jgi:hypothetical protein
MCRQDIGKKCCAVAEAYGVLLYCNTFSASEVRIITASESFAARLPKLFRRAFGLEFDSAAGESGGKVTYTVTDKAKLEKLFSAFGYDRSVLSLHINLGVLEDDCCRESFLRGAFLAGGSVTDPEKRYHMEFVTGHYSVSRETYSLFLEMGFSPKETARAGNYITYFKQSETIADVLTTMSAPVGAMELMNDKALKDLKNSVNRRVNCDTGNASKIVDAAAQQLAAIKKLHDTGADEGLSEQLKETARLRYENPEASISELAAMCDPPVTKSCVNHRLRKLVELSEGC